MGNLRHSRVACACVLVAGAVRLAACRAESVASWTLPGAFGRRVPEHAAHAGVTPAVPWRRAGCVRKPCPESAMGQGGSRLNAVQWGGGGLRVGCLPTLEKPFSGQNPANRLSSPQAEGSVRLPIEYRGSRPGRKTWS